MNPASAQAALYNQNLTGYEERQRSKQKSFLSLSRKRAQTYLQSKQDVEELSRAEFESQCEHLINDCTSQEQDYITACGLSKNFKAGVEYGTKSPFETAMISQREHRVAVLGIQRPKVHSGVIRTQMLSSLQTQALHMDVRKGHERHLERAVLDTEGSGETSAVLLMKQYRHYGERHRASTHSYSANSLSDSDSLSTSGCDVLLSNPCSSSSLASLELRDTTHTESLPPPGGQHTRRLSVVLSPLVTHTPTHLAVPEELCVAPDGDDKHTHNHRHPEDKPESLPPTPRSACSLPSSVGTEPLERGRGRRLTKTQQASIRQLLRKLCSFNDRRRAAAYVPSLSHQDRTSIYNSLFSGLSFVLLNNITRHVNRTSQAIQTNTPHSVFASNIAAVTASLAHLSHTHDAVVKSSATLAAIKAIVAGKLSLRKTLAPKENLRGKGSVGYISDHHDRGKTAKAPRTTSLQGIQFKTDFSGQYVVGQQGQQLAVQTAQEILDVHKVKPLVYEGVCPSKSVQVQEASRASLGLGSQDTGGSNPLSKGRKVPVGGLDNSVVVINHIDTDKTLTLNHNVTHTKARQLQLQQQQLNPNQQFRVMRAGPGLGVDGSGIVGFSRDPQPREHVHFDTDLPFNSYMPHQPQPSDSTTPATLIQGRQVSDATVSATPHQTNEDALNSARSRFGHLGPQNTYHIQGQDRAMWK